MRPIRDASPIRGGSVHPTVSAPSPFASGSGGRDDRTVTWTASRGRRALFENAARVGERTLFYLEYNRLAEIYGMHALEPDEYGAAASTDHSMGQQKRGWFSRKFPRQPSATSQAIIARLGKKVGHKRSISGIAMQLMNQKKRDLEGEGPESLIRLCGKSTLHMPLEFAIGPLTLPTCFRATAQYLIQHGTDTRGLFRIPGSIRNVNALYKYYCTEQDGDSISTTTRYPDLPSHINAGVHDVASTFKRFLSGLPGGILGSLPLFDALVAIHSQQLPEHPGMDHVNQTGPRAKLIALAIGTLESQYRRDLIYAVFGLLSLVGGSSATATDQQDGGRRPATPDLKGYDALGIVFGPLLLGDLINSYTTGVTDPQSGLALSMSASPKRWGDKRKSRKLREMSPTSSCVDNIRVASNITEMLISHWKAVVVYMKRHRGFKPVTESQTSTDLVQRSHGFIPGNRSVGKPPLEDAEDDRNVDVSLVAPNSSFEYNEIGFAVHRQILGQMGEVSNSEGSNTSDETLVHHRAPYDQASMAASSETRAQTASRTMDCSTLGVEEVADESSRSLKGGECGGNAEGHVESSPRLYRAYGTDGMIVVASKPSSIGKASGSSLEHKQSILDQKPGFSRSEHEQPQTGFECLTPSVSHGDAFPQTAPLSRENHGYMYSSSVTKTFTADSSVPRTAPLPPKVEVPWTTASRNSFEDLPKTATSSTCGESASYAPVGATGARSVKAMAAMFEKRASKDQGTLMRSISPSKSLASSIRSRPEVYVSNGQTGDHQASGSQGAATDPREESPAGPAEPAEFSRTAATQTTEDVQSRAESPTFDGPVGVWNGWASGRKRRSLTLHKETTTFREQLQAKEAEVAHLRRRAEISENIVQGSIREQLRAANRQYHAWRRRAEAAEERVRILERSISSQVGISAEEEDAEEADAEEADAEEADAEEADAEEADVEEAGAEEADAEEAETDSAALGTPRPRPHNPARDVQYESLHETAATTRHNDAVLLNPAEPVPQQPFRGLGAPNVDDSARAGEGTRAVRANAHQNQAGGELFSAAGSWVAAQGLLEEFGESRHGY